MIKNKTLVCIVGPTAIGKTNIGIELAEHFNTEILSADSRQLYKEMSVGTAKPSQTELNRVKHHFINHISITKDYSVGDFEREAIQLIETLFQKKDFLFLVGGSGLFVNAIINGLDDIPEIEYNIRAKINKEFDEQGITFLQKKLETTDPKAFESIDVKNPRRLIRAIEVFEQTGKSITDFRKRKPKKRNFNIISIGINTEREKLYERINSRVDKMIEEGLLNEVKKLIQFKHYQALKTVGYKELFPFLEETENLEYCIEKIKKNTRNYAKRQITWFKKNENLKWFDNSATYIKKDILDYIIKKSRYNF